MTRRVTLADVADRAGVSKTAASLVLNGRPGSRLSEDVADRVRAAAAALLTDPTRPLGASGWEGRRSSGSSPTT